MSNKDTDNFEQVTEVDNGYRLLLDMLLQDVNSKEEIYGND